MKNTLITPRLLLTVTGKFPQRLVPLTYWFSKSKPTSKIIIWVLVMPCPTNGCWEQFRAARNTVREAIRILKAYGVVEVRPKIGAVIVNRHTDAVLDLFSFHMRLSPDTFRDIQGFRRLIKWDPLIAFFPIPPPKISANYATSIPKC